MTWTHDALMNDLAEHLRQNTARMVWTDMQIGPSGSQRPDVYALDKTYNKAKFRPIAYEIKVSVADFRSDVTSGKWQGYLNYASGVIFAVPAGLITKNDIPPSCGLMVRGDNGWKRLKGPTLRHLETLPHAAWMKLLIDGADREFYRREPRDRGQPSAWLANQQVRKKYGARVAGLLADIDGLEAKKIALEVDYARRTKALSADYERARAEMEKRHAEDIASIDPQLIELCKEIGIDPSRRWLSGRAIRNRFEEMRAALNSEFEIARLRRALEETQQTLNQALKEPITIGENT